MVRLGCYTSCGNIVRTGAPFALDTPRTGEHGQDMYASSALIALGLQCYARIRGRCTKHGWIPAGGKRMHRAGGVQEASESMMSSSLTVLAEGDYESGDCEPRVMLVQSGESSSSTHRPIMSGPSQWEQIAATCTQVHRSTRTLRHGTRPWELALGLVAAFGSIIHCEAVYIFDHTGLPLW